MGRGWWEMGGETLAAENEVELEVLVVRSSPSCLMLSSTGWAAVTSFQSCWRSEGHTAEEGETRKNRAVSSRGGRGRQHPRAGLAQDPMGPPQPRRGALTTLNPQTFGVGEAPKPAPLLGTAPGLAAAAAPRCFLGEKPQPWGRPPVPPNPVPYLGEGSAGARCPGRAGGSPAPGAAGLTGAAAGAAASAGAAAGTPAAYSLTAAGRQKGGKEKPR